MHPNIDLNIKISQVSKSGVEITINNIYLIYYKSIFYTSINTKTT